MTAAAHAPTAGPYVVNQLRARRSHSKLLVYTWKRIYS